MAITKNVKTVNVNLVYEGEIMSDTKNSINKIRDQVIEIWGGGVDPIITQFPEVVAVHLPQQQFSLVAERNRAIFVNQDVKPFEGRIEDIDKMIKFINEFAKIIPATIRAYGFNYVLEIKSTAKGAFKKQLINCLNSTHINKKLGLKKTDLVNAGIQVQYKYSNGKASIKISPFTDFDDKVLVEINVHFGGDTLPDYQLFKKTFTDSFVDLSERATKLLTITP